MQAAGVEEAPERKSAAPVPFGQFLNGGIVLLDVPQLVGDTAAVQPGLCFSAGRAFGVAEKGHVHHSFTAHTVTKERRICKCLWKKGMNGSKQEEIYCISSIKNEIRRK